MPDPNDPHFAERDKLLIPQEDLVEAVAGFVQENTVEVGEAEAPLDERYDPNDSATESNLKPYVAPLISGDEELAQLRAMVAQLQQSVESQASAVNRGRASSLGVADEGFPWQYFRRPPVGPMGNWIVITPGGRNSKGVRPAEAYAHYLAKGFKPIEAYGPAPKPTTEKGWRSMIPMLRKGGAKEFPIAQVLAYKWHVEPPIPGLTFPQITGEDVLHADCEECDWEMFGEKGDRNISKAFLVHLRDSHNYPRREAIILIAEQGLPQIGRMREANRAIPEISLGSMDFTPAPVV